MPSSAPKVLKKSVSGREGGSWLQEQGTEPGLGLSEQNAQQRQEQNWYVPKPLQCAAGAKFSAKKTFSLWTPDTLLFEWAGLFWQHGEDVI